MQLNHLKKILKENNLFTKKSLDQHFLYDSDILKREVEYAGVTELDTVLEIGPGIGTLTAEIAKKTKNVTVIEKDARFKPMLEKLGVEVIIGDALEVEWPVCTKILSNLPYSISSQLTFDILKRKPEVAVLCYQKEFADRMIALPGTSDYSRLSVNCTMRANVEVLETVPKEKYYPVPLVDSAIVRLKPKEVSLPEKFDDVVRALFQHKNKKVRNALLDSHHEIGEEEKVREFVGSIGSVADQKVKELAPGEIVELSLCYKE